MKRISTLISFITIFLLSSCTSQPAAFTDYEPGQTGSKKMVKANASSEASKFLLVSGNRPAAKAANADANWVASSNPHVVAATSRRSHMDAATLSAATTHEGHDILKKEIGKAMKSSRASQNKKARKKTKPSFLRDNDIVL